MVDVDRIKNVLGRLASVEADLGDPAVLSDAKRYRATLRDHAFLKKLESAFRAYEKAAADIRGNEELLADPDFRDEAQREIDSLRAALPDLERRVMASLLEPDPFEGRNAVMEIRAGTGGEEAALFAGDFCGDGVSEREDSFAVFRLAEGGEELLLLNTLYLFSAQDLACGPGGFHDATALLECQENHYSPVRLTQGFPFFGGLTGVSAGVP